MSEYVQTRPLLQVQPCSCICRHVSPLQSLFQEEGSLTAQYHTFINQRHFQCPITETQLLALSGTDSSPIHLPGEKSRPVPTCSTELLNLQKDPLKLFSLGQANNKKGKLLVSSNTRGISFWLWMVEMLVKMLIWMRQSVDFKTTSLAWKVPFDPQALESAWRSE